jgi:hypothetical protein
MAIWYILWQFCIFFAYLCPEKDLATRFSSYVGTVKVRPSFLSRRRLQISNEDDSDDEVTLAKDQPLDSGKQVLMSMVS